VQCPTDQDRGHQYEHRYGHEDEGIDEAEDAAGDQRHGHWPEPAKRKDQRHEQGHESQWHAGDQQQEQGDEHRPCRHFDPHGLKVEQRCEKVHHRSCFVM